MKVIGLALKKDKCDKHISQDLIEKARASGFELKVLDPDLPLEEQGRLDAILQKLRNPEWEAQLEGYAASNTHVKVFDIPSATMPIRHRGTMLKMLEGGPWIFQEPSSGAEGEAHGRTNHHRNVCRVSVPTNTTLAEGISFRSAVHQLELRGIRYPFLVKPAWADGRPGSHALAVVGSDAGLEQLIEGEPAQQISLPVLVQEYVEHGGCLFKVYVLGSRAVMVTRSSLQLRPSCSSVAQHQTTCSAATAAAWGCADGAAAARRSSQSCCAREQVGDRQGHQEHPGRHQEAAGSVHQGPASPSGPPTPPDAGGARVDLELVQRVSAYPRSRSWGKRDLAPEGHGVASPPEWLIQQLAARLRQHLGLTLFNFDVIVPKQQQQAACEAAAEAEANCRQGSDCGRKGMAEEYHLIDINYFPGYEKLPGYENLMVQFFESIWAEEADACPSDRI